MALMYKLPELVSQINLDDLWERANIAILNYGLQTLFTSFDFEDILIMKKAVLEFCIAA